MKETDMQSLQSVDKVRRMLEQGYELHLAPHDASNNLVGFLAIFIHTTKEGRFHLCDECENYDFSWHDAGHGFTIDEAIDQAYRMAVVEDTTPYEFEHYSWKHHPELLRKYVDLSNAQINFFEVEIRNEAEGGDSPSTLQSALDSLKQAPPTVIEDWCDEDTVRGNVQDFIDSIQHLVDRWGGSVKLADLLPREE